MITNFEKETHELTEYELSIVPIIVGKIENNIGKEKAVKNKDIIRNLEMKGYKVNAARVRKLIHYIRIERLVVNLIATSKGYYVAESSEEVEKFVLSLQQRINSIQSVKNSFI